MDWGLFQRGNITDFPSCNGAELFSMADFSKLSVKNKVVQLVLRDFVRTN